MNKICNYYVTKNNKEYRIIAIAGYWKLCVKKSDIEWLFVNENEYETANEAMADI